MKTNNKNIKKEEILKRNFSELLLAAQIVVEKNFMNQDIRCMDILQKAIKNATD